MKTHIPCSCFVWCGIVAAVALAEVRGETAPADLLEKAESQKAQDLVPLAKSWLQPAPFELKQAQARYEPAERAYQISGTDPGGVEGTLQADPEHPALNPAFVLNGLRLENPAVRIDGKLLAPGKDFQHGTVRELEQWKTVIWLDRDCTQPVKIGITP